jgi:signal transduction histidine kinase
MASTAVRSFLLADVPLIGLAVLIDYSGFLLAKPGSATELAMWCSTAVVFLALLARRRLPKTVFALHFAHQAVFSLLGDMSFGLGLLIAVHAVARRCERRVSVVLALACAVPIGIQTVVTAEWYAPAQTFWLRAGLTAAAWMLGYWMRRAVQEQAAADAALDARRAERALLARELHEIITSSVEVMRGRAAQARGALGGDTQLAARALEAVQDAGTRTMAELQRMLTVMRRPADEARPRRFDPRHLVDAALVTGVFAIDWDVWLSNLFPADRSRAIWFEVAALLTLTLRWRWPLPILFLQIAYVSKLIQVQPDSVYIAGPLIGVHAAARLCPPRHSVPATCCLALPIAFAMQQQDDVGGVGLALEAVVAAVITAGPWLLGNSMRRAAEGRETVRAAGEQRRAEQQQLACELHDIVSHTVTMMMLQAAGARSVLDRNPGRAAEALDAIRDAGGRSMTELDRLHTLLVPPDEAGSEAPSPPGLDGLDQLLESIRATGLTVTVETTGTPEPLDASVDATAYRVVQEALTNSAKYAGTSGTARVQLDWTGLELRIEVADRRGDRRGAVPTTGNGLLGLHERVTAVGGDLDTGPLRDGFLVAATLPLPSLGVASHDKSSYLS